MRVIALACLTLSLSVTQAFADPPITTPLYGLRYTDSLKIAVEFWDATPPCTVRMYAATNAQLEATVGYPADAAVRAVQTGPDCPVWIGPDYDDDFYDNRISVCGLIVHEVGHLLGYQHVNDPASIMYPWGLPTVYGCYHRFLPRGYGQVWRADHDGVVTFASRP